MSVLATDTFTRANETPLASPWTTAGDTGTFVLASNAVTYGNQNNDTSYYTTAVSSITDQYSQAVCSTASSGGGGIGPGVGVRMATSQNYYRLVADHGGTNNWELGKRVASTYTVLWDRTQSWTNGDVFYLEVQGTTLIAKRNGVAIGASTSDSALAAGRPGLSYSSSAFTSTMDTWEGGNFAVAGMLRQMQQQSA